VDVEDDDVGMKFPDQLQGRFAVACLADQLKSGSRFNHVAQAAAEDRMVIGNQDPEFFAHQEWRKF
jgi:hypothetical protein